MLKLSLCQKFTTFSKAFQLTKISTKYIYLNRFVVLTAQLLKIQAFLDITLCHWSSRLFEMKGTTHPVTQHNITVCLNLQYSPH
jgi:hypothetical protein